MQSVFGERGAPGVRSASAAESPLIRSSVQSRAARASAATTIGALAFLATYMAMHASFIAGYTPVSMIRISRVPLFATCITSAVVGALTLVVGLLSIEDGVSVMPRLKLPLAIVTFLFTLEILLAP